jgi:hypothetical protein
MTPWFTMPNDAQARHQAAVEDLDAAVSGIARALDRIAEQPLSQRDRQLLRLMSGELARIRRAVQVLNQK